MARCGRRKVKRGPYRIEISEEQEEFMQAQPYLMFEGRTEEALEFYKSALGAKIEAVMRYGDTPETTEHRPSGIEGQGDALGVQDRQLEC